MIALFPIVAAVTAAAAGQAAPPATAQALSGVYASDQAEVAAALQLDPSGTFRYVFDYGAVSEIAEGRWASDGRSVRLTSDPMPTPPSFAIVKDEPAPRGEYVVTFEDPGFDWGGPLQLLLNVEGVSAWVRATPDERGRIESSGARILAIRPIIPVFDLIGPVLPLKGSGGHRVTIKFLRNDLGKARFNGEPLSIEPGGLLLNRYGTSIRLRRVASPGMPSGK